MVTQIEGIDASFAQLSVDEIKQAGAHWIARYFSADPAKDLTAAEVTEYNAAGLPIVTVWETSTTRATEGYSDGAADAHEAELQRGEVGLPSDHVHYFAVDENTSWASVADYFAGAASVLGQARVGVYGSFAVVEGAYAAGYRYLWQTSAWSDGSWSTHATIRQTGGTVLQGGADVDQAEVPDFGQSPRPAPPEPAPEYQPFPGVEWFHAEPPHNSPIVTAMGKRLVEEDCSAYHIGPGPQWTDADRQSYQKWQLKEGYEGTELGGAADGWPGPASWAKLRVPLVQ